MWMKSNPSPKGLLNYIQQGFGLQGKNGEEGEKTQTFGLLKLPGKRTCDKHTTTAEYKMAQK